MRAYLRTVVAYVFILCYSCVYGHIFAYAYFWGPSDLSPHPRKNNSQPPTQEEEEEGSGEEELGLWASLIGLLVITGVVAVFSEFLVSSIDDVCRTYNISKARN